MKDETRSRSFFILHPSAFILLGLTILGGILRFTYLDRPSIWGDEAATYARVCGTFQQLVNELVIVGFAPLHYLLYWWIGQHAALTPVMMRLAPATAGTLMIPAMFFLASQLVNRKTALLVAAMTAGSAYMLNYSRDAKMYAELWLFVILHAACLLWWLRTRSVISWTAWLTSGIAMLGLQSVSLAMLPIELLIVLTSHKQHWKSLLTLLMTIPCLPVLAAMRFERFNERNRFGRFLQKFFQNFRWPPLALFLLGIAIMLSGPLIYYTKFNVYSQRIYKPSEEQLELQRTGIEWVVPYNQGRDGVDLPRYLATAYLYSWEWPKLSQQPLIAERTLKLLKAVGIVMAVILLIAATPWKRHAGTSWRGRFWLAAWVILPAYGFYCVSIKDAAWPIDWLRMAHEHLHWWAWLIAAALCADWLLIHPFDWRKTILHVVGWLQVLASLFLLCTAIHWAIPKNFQESVWIPRYLGFTWPAFIIIVSALLMRLPRPLRVIAISFFLIVNLSQHFCRLFAGSEPPTALMVHDLLDTQPPSGGRMFYAIPPPGIPEPGAGEFNTISSHYYTALFRGKTVSPDMVRRGLENSDYQFSFRLVGSIENNITAYLTKNPDITRIVLWEKLAPGQIGLNDPVLEKLPPQWKRVSEDLFHVRDHWTWRDVLTARRRVYEKKIPATLPATNP